MTADFLGGWITWLTVALAAASGLVSFLVVSKATREADLARHDLDEALKKSRTAALEAEIQSLKAQLDQNKSAASGATPSVQ